MNNIKYIQGRVQLNKYLEMSCQSNLHESGIKDNLLCKSKYQNVEICHSYLILKPDLQDYIEFSNIYIMSNCIIHAVLYKCILLIL